MTERTVPVDGGRFNTEVVELGKGEPLLFLHGTFGLEADRFLDRLSEQYRVIAPRHPGYGNSSGSEQLLDIHDLIYYYLDYLDAEGLRGVPLVGHSLGAMFAAELAAVQPERFSNLVLMDAFGLWNAEYPVADFFAMMPRELGETLYHDPNSPTAQAASKPPEENEAFIAFMLERAKSLATAAKYLWPIPNRGLSKRLHRIAAPTLLIWGESDKLVPPQYGKAFQAGIKGARLELIKGAGHLPQVEQPEQTAETVLSFLGEK
ncbi:MAG TPA: alpha/beta hydrolase [Dehalococcoidia bacterium]|nr:alpha/beta hydrolase [Dehalococcoidia bacterium]